MVATDARELEGWAGDASAIAAHASLFEISQVIPGQSPSRRLSTAPAPRAGYVVTARPAATGARRFGALAPRRQE